MYRNSFYYITGIFIVALIFSGFSSTNSGKAHSPNPMQDHESYVSEWKKVDSLINIRLPKSALEITESIYQQARASDNHPQLIKAVLYKVRLSSEFEEDFFENTASDLLAEVDEAKSPAKQVLHSILAEIYWRYYQSNRGIFYDRTMIAGIEKGDLRTWDLNTLMNEIIRNYFASLEMPDDLKGTPLDAYDVILDTASKSKLFRPTLYDFLAHRAVDFFMNDESSIVQPAYRFELENEEDFSGVNDFIDISYETRDSLSLKYHALLIFQELLAFHVNDRDPSAIVDVNLKRLGFVHRNSIHPLKDSLYVEALKAYEADTREFPSSTEVSSALATELYRQSSQYDPAVSEKFRWGAQEAKTICEDAVSRFPGSTGALKCGKLLDAITKSTYRITTEKENVPGKPMLSLLSYKNLTTLHFRLVKLDYKEHRSMLRELRQRQELLEKYVSMPPVQSWTQSVPDAGDFQEHNTEIKLPGMSAGYYLLLSSETDTFTPDSSSVSYQTFWVSNISFISQGMNKGGYSVYLLDRESGAALKGVDIKLFYRSYDYSVRSYQYTEGGSFTSDDRGFFEIPPLAANEKPNSFFLEFSLKDDQLITDDRFYHSGYSPREEKKQLSAFLFTDRGIYRPGQTVYFKGILVEKSEDERAVKAGQELHVEFMDVNYQKIAELKLMTSDYGSVQGSFVVPQGVLNGRMTIKTKWGSRTIQVEDYKRPNFEIVFKPVEGSYKLGQLVNMTGSARAFAGNSIGGAKVQYRVVRETYYPWQFGYYGHFPVRSSMEITNGTTFTDDEGNFFIEFEAMPDHTIPSRFKPAFRYTVHASVTDINNETQSGISYVSVGTQALQIELGIGEVENTQDFTAIPFRVTNLNGQAVSAKGKVTIMLLEEPDRLLREQLWSHPDVFVMEQEDFIRDFPFDSYSKENEPASLKVSSIALEQDFDSSIDTAISLAGAKSWKPGRYRIKVESKDEFGADVEIEQYFILFSPEDKKPPIHEMNWFYVLKNRCEPGENARFVMGTKDRKVSVLYEVVHKENVIKSEWMVLDDEQRLIEIPVTEAYRGGFKVNLLFVKHNRIFSNNFGVDVPYTNKELDVEFISFRDKLLPGQEEEFSVRIKGKKGDQVAAELLTSMYDQSLDQFTGHDWRFNLFTSPYHGGIWNTNTAFHNTTASKFFMPPPDFFPTVIQGYDQLNWFGFSYYGANYYFRGAQGDVYARQEAMPGKVLETAGVASLEAEDMGDQESASGQPKVGDDQNVAGLDSIPPGLPSTPQLRRDFRETAFFFPALKTDENGDVIIRFTMPESLTRWKLMGLAHTKELEVGRFTREIITTKELMVVPNPPRFFRQRDQFDFSAKLVNLAEKELNGEVVIRFFNTVTMQEITGEILADGDNTRSFNMETGKSSQVSWSIQVPEKYDLITYRVMASSASHTDGEEKALPVLTNRMLVTEALPLPVKGNETKKFTLKKLTDLPGTGSLANHKLTLEFSSNPAWYAVQALPYIMEGSQESADNVFNRFYANAIAAYIVRSNPRIRQVFDAWKEYTPDAMLSNLDKNEELKALILDETPWVRDAQNESERKQRIAVLFDVNKMADEQDAALRILLQKQSPGGGWPWFKGMPDSRNITQQIITGFGHLKQLGVFDATGDSRTRAMMVSALRYLDQMILEDYEKLLEYKADLDKNHLGSLQIQYLYARGYFLDDVKIPGSSRVAVDYYLGQASNYWTLQGILQKAMITLALQRNGVKDVPGRILASLKEYALSSDEMGMYWRDNKGGYFWHEAPIEAQAFLIEAFDEVLKDEESVDQMKIWLLKQKQTQNWKTPRATAAAVYALLLRGGDWLSSDKLAVVTVGTVTVDPFELEDTKVEAGTGYFKTSWPGGEIKPEMGEVSVKNENSTIAWGALYWQYFEDLDKITFAETPLSISKKLFVKRNTAAGPVLEPLGQDANVGDVIIVRIEIRVDRDMEYIHMKDMRASALEPLNVISGYRYQGGLGYYESTRDAATNFFFDYLPKGTYVFEYPLVASQKGDFSNGITTIQCMYAPEFTSHSEGIRILVEQ